MGKISLQYDNWGNSERLCNIVPKNAPRLDDCLTVAEMIDNGSWQWPNGWLQAYPYLA